MRAGQGRDQGKWTIIIAQMPSKNKEIFCDITSEKENCSCKKDMGCLKDVRKNK
jgi:ArsR family transcriptional regulator